MTLNFIRNYKGITTEDEIEKEILKYNEKMKVILDIFNTTKKRENVSLKKICKRYKKSN